MFYNVDINHDPVMTLTYFIKVILGCKCTEMGKTVKMSFEGKVLQEMGSRTGSRPTGVQLVFFFCSGVSRLFGAQGSPSSGSLLNL